MMKCPANAHLPRVTDQEHEYDAKECPRDALVPLQPGLDPPVGAEVGGGLGQALVHAVGAVDHHDGRGDDHHDRVHHQRIPADV